jgi:hypothetical protein
VSAETKSAETEGADKDLRSRAILRRFGTASDLFLDVSIFPKHVGQSVGMSHARFPGLINTSFP